MARRKKIDPPAEEEITSNISSMIDCCFLLLIYFLAATSLVSEKKLDISIPPPGGTASSKPKVDPGNIYVTKAGVVTWNEGLTVGEAYDPSLEPGTPAYLQQRRMESLVENLKMLKEQADAVDTTPVVMLHGAAGAPHQRIVDVMAALSEADIHSVGLSTTADE